MMVKLSSVIEQNIVAPKIMLDRLIFNQNYSFRGGWVGGWGWLVALMVIKANISKLSFLLAVASMSFSFD